MSSIPLSQMSASSNSYQLPFLTTLDLRPSRQLTSASGDICQLRSLITLDLPSRQLTSRSDRIAQLALSNTRDLSNGRFSSPSDQRGWFQDSGVVNSTNNRRTHDQNRLIVIEQAIRYFAFPPPEVRAFSQAPTHFSLMPVSLMPMGLTQTKIEQLFSLSQLNQLSPEEKVVVQNWLRRLDFTEDYRRGGEFRDLLVKEILRILQRANDDSKFRASFLTTIQNSVGSCGDDFALSVLRVGIAFRLREIGADNIRALKTFLIQTVWAVEMLAGSAEKKIKDSADPTLDTVEVYLAFPIMLQQELDLDILPKDMRWFDYSRLTPEDLKKAADHVKEQRADRDAVCTFLSRCTEWTEVLKAQYPVECAEIAKKDYEQLDGAGNDPELFKKLEIDREKRWKDLTQSVLDAIN